MAEMITQCPKCSTAFHVTEALLSSAKGAVRCGTCLTVFNGRAHLQHQEEELVEIDISEYEVAERKKPKSKTKKKDYSKDAVITPKSDDHEVQEVSDDESWVLDLLAEEGHEPSQIGLVPKQEKDEELTNKESTQGEKNAPKKESKDKTEDAQSAATQLIQTLEPEPVEVEFRGKRGFFSSKIVWSILAFVGLFALLGQIAWLKYPELNKYEPYRSFYGFACEYIGCVLPEQIDREKIDIVELSVQSHPDPEKPNALLVDASLINKAPFKQSFPDLRLSFNKTNGEFLTERTFSPEEYLGSDLEGVNLMPTNAKVHIELELQDPGEIASGYKVDIVR